jgi:hypothetical protein
MSSMGSTQAPAPTSTMSSAPSSPPVMTFANDSARNVPQIPLDQTEYATPQQAPGAEVAGMAGAEDMMRSQRKRDPGTDRRIQMDIFDGRVRQEMINEGWPGDLTDQDGFWEWLSKKREREGVPHTPMR